MKLYTVTNVYNGTRDFQHIRACSRDEAIRIAEEMEADDCANEDYREMWFAEEEEEE